MSVVIIDTQVIVWSLLDSGQLSKPAEAALERASRVHASAASLYEIAYKRGLEAQRGHRSILHQLPDDLTNHLPRLGLHLLDVTPAIAEMAARLPIDHGDPWDRIILAHAVTLNVPLVSSDRRLRLTNTATVIW